MHHEGVVLNPATPKLVIKTPEKNPRMDPIFCPWRTCTTTRHNAAQRGTMDPKLAVAAEADRLFAVLLAQSHGINAATWVRLIPLAMSAASTIQGMAGFERKALALQLLQRLLRELPGIDETWRGVLLSILPTVGPAAIDVVYQAASEFYPFLKDQATSLARSRWCACACFRGASPSSASAKASTKARVRGLSDVETAACVIADKARARFWSGAHTAGNWVEVVPYAMRDASALRLTGPQKREAVVRGVSAAMHDLVEKPDAKDPRSPVVGEGLREPSAFGYRGNGMRLLEHAAVGPIVGGLCDVLVAAARGQTPHAGSERKRLERARAV